MSGVQTSFPHLYHHFYVHPTFDAIMTIGLVQTFFKNIQANTTTYDHNNEKQRTEFAQEGNRPARNWCGQQMLPELDFSFPI
jgi:hypothetical protein